MGVRLFVVRHGETGWSRGLRFTGRQDVPLTAEGRRQAEVLAHALADVPLVAVYASPLERARVTAEAIAKPHGLDVRLAAAFAEMGFGDWEGLGRDEIAARFPEAWATWRAAPTELARPGGERLDDVAARVAAALAELRAVHDGGCVALVTHAIPARLLVLAALGLGPERLWAIDASPGGVSEIEYQAEWVTLHRMNTVAHLDGGERG
jgi:phosphoserine phosphatase